MTGNIYSFSRGRILPQIQAWTDSLHWKCPKPGKLWSKLQLSSWLPTVKIYLKLTLAYECFQLFKISWFFRSFTIFTLMRKLYSLNNSFKSKDSQSSESHIEIRSWKDNYHVPILQRCMKKGTLMCCTGLCLYTLSVISHLCRWSLISKIRKSRIRNCRSLFLNPGS